MLLENHADHVATATEEEVGADGRRDHSWGCARALVPRTGVRSGQLQNSFPKKRVHLAL